MKKIFKIFCIMLAVGLNCACSFPDKLPVWDDLPSYKLQTLKFAQTTAEQFRVLSPNISGRPEGTDIFIFGENITDNDSYKGVRIGFKNEKLDWIEFALLDGTKIADFVYYYGKPDNINTKYSKLYDYYDYGFFNVSTDKSHNYAYNLTLFDNPYDLDKTTEIDSDIPSIAQLNYSRKLKPGYLSEEYFREKYPAAKAIKKNEFDTDSVYLLKNELGRSSVLYDTVQLNFKNGILLSVYLQPKNVFLQRIQGLYGKSRKIQVLNESYEIHEYPNFFVTVNKATKKIKSIAIVSAS